MLMIINCKIISTFLYKYLGKFFIQTNTLFKLHINIFIFLKVFIPSRNKVALFKKKNTTAF